MKKWIKSFWKQHNELIILAIGIIAFIWLQLGNLLKPLLIAVIMIAFAGAAAWYWMRFTFPEVSSWMDDFVGHKMFQQKPSFEKDWQRTWVIVTIYALYLVVCLIAVVASVIIFFSS